MEYQLTPMGSFLLVRKVRPAITISVIRMAVAAVKMWPVDDAEKIGAWR